MEFLRDYQPDLIHIQNRLSAPLGQKISRKLRVPHVITVHRVPDGRPPHIQHPYLAGVIAVNEVIRESLVNNHGIPKSLVRVIQHGVDVDALTPERSDAQAAVGGAPGKPGLIPVVGSVGRLTRVKGQHIFLKAARRVLDRGFEAMFAIVGEGEEEQSLRKVVKELGLQYNVTFSPHILNRRELYRIFDIVVVPTLRGGMGSTTLEAMAMGKPVIASAVGEVLHIVQDGKTGLLVPEGDADAIADQICTLIARPELCRTLGSQARAYVVESFALAPMVKATRDLYEHVGHKLKERGVESTEAAGAR
jgi:glycosyltransferase involved in cell wall biosynthesis